VRGEDREIPVASKLSRGKNGQTYPATGDVASTRIRKKREPLGKSREKGPLGAAS